MKPTDEKILEFCRAKEVWVWNDDPNRAVIGAPKDYHIDIDYPFRVQLKGGNFYNGKHFSLEKPVVYEIGVLYAAERNGFPIMVKYSPGKSLNKKEIFESALDYHTEYELTNIRRIPKEMWSD